MKKNNKIFIAIFIIIVVILMIQYNEDLRPISTEDDKEVIKVELPLGSSVKGISEQLAQQGVIKTPLVFRIYSKLEKINGKYKAGIYYLDTGMSVKEIAEILQHGKGYNEVVRFTIPEGYEVRMIIDKFEELGIGDKDRFHEIIDNYSYDYDFLENISENAIPLEGYLFPDTYEIFKNAKEEDIIRKMLDRFNSVFTDEYRERTAELNMTINDVITLASIIEREAKADKERKIVSSVFHNRLKINMLLGSCATIQYILKERKEALQTKDLEVESLYNTYKHPGLPPGPIASPGKKSIEAALYPDDTDYLYFVAEKDGTHYFSKTLDEHLRAQKRINSE